MPVVKLNLDAASTGNSKFGTLAAGDWAVQLVEVRTGESTVKKTPYVELVWKVVDGEAVDTDGQKFSGKVWDTYYVTDKALFRVKKVASALGVDLGLDGDGEVEVDTDELADAFREAQGDEVTVTTQVREFVHNGEERSKAEVVDVAA